MRAPVSDIRVVFLDDGGVLNDNERRAPEWRRLLGEYFAPRFGGTPEAWGEANAIVIEELWREWLSVQERQVDIAVDWFDERDPWWLASMCERVGVPLPADVAGTVSASKAYVMANIDCAYPEAADAVRAISARGIAVHLASGGHSLELAPYLERMGIRGLVGRPYGRDLIGVYKTSPRYYARIAEDSGADPGTSLVVDSHAEPLEWADATGFRTVHVDRLGSGSRFTRIPSLDGILALLD